MALAVFGKLPALGDFVTRDFDPDLLRGWERWCAETTSQSRAAMGEAWADAWAASPVWRFWIGPGVFGQALAGCWRPSMDRVGRRFPLSAAVSGGAVPPPPVANNAEALDWYDRLAAAMAEVTAERGDADFDATFAAVGMPVADTLMGGERAYFAQGTVGTAALLRDLTAYEGRLGATRRSYWWCGRPGSPDCTVLALDGLPGVSEVAAMLTFGGEMPAPDRSDEAPLAEPIAPGEMSEPQAPAEGEELAEAAPDPSDEPEDAVAGDTWDLATPADHDDEADFTGPSGDDASPFDADGGAGLDWQSTEPQTAEGPPETKWQGVSGQNDPVIGAEPEEDAHASPFGGPDVTEQTPVSPKGRWRRGLADLGRRRH